MVIDSDEAYALADELSALTGESITASVMVALRERLARERQAREHGARRAGAEALGRALRAHAGPGIPVNHCWADRSAPRPG